MSLVCKKTKDICMPTKKQLENLKPQNKRTKSEQREIAKNGGIISGKTRKEKRNFQQACRWFLETKNEDGLTNLEMIIIKQGEKALNGELPSAVFIRDTAGQKPTDKVEQTVNREPIKIKIID
jgi:hypothetical protein